jgi:alkylation response protein AidB-like acyl-CoA dehydrogenase
MSFPSPVRRAPESRTNSDYFFEGQHETLRDEVRRFAAREVVPRVGGMEDQRVVEVGLARENAARGWIGVTIARRYGGMDLCTAS